MAGGKVVTTEGGGTIIKTEDAIPMYHEVFGGKERPRFAHKVQRRQEIKAEMDRLGTELGDSKYTNEPGLNQEIELLMAEHNVDTVNVDEWTVIATGGNNVSIKKELLQQAMLEAGMEPAVITVVIEAATITKPYTYIQVTKTKRLIERTTELGISPLAKKKIHAVAAKAKGGKKARR